MGDDFLRKLNEELAVQMEMANRTPRKDFDNLSPMDMQGILYHLLQKQSPIQYSKQLKSAIVAKAPFYQLFREYLNRIADAKEIKLTTRGNLPRKLVLELYGLGLIKEYEIERGITKLSKEADSIALQNVKILGELSGLTKKRNNKLSLTKKGTLLTAKGKEVELFKLLFETNSLKFNLGYHDGFGANGLQVTFGYTLYLLLKYGEKMSPLSFYAEKTIQAFPHVFEEFQTESWSTPEKRFQSCFDVRFFKRLLTYYKFVTFEEGEMRTYSDDNQKVATTPLFRSVFEIDQEKFQFIKSK